MINIMMDMTFGNWYESIMMLKIVLLDVEIGNDIKLKYDNDDIEHKNTNDVACIQLKIKNKYIVWWGHQINWIELY